MVLSEISTAFVLGLLTPLTAACVLPLYPGFIAYLATQLKGKEAVKNTVALAGTLMAAGAIVFMFFLGLLFTSIFEVSLTNVIGIISPIAFVILVGISLILIFDINLGKYFPKIKTPTTKYPMLNAFLFGFFFGAIVVPCNPAFIAALFARTAAMGDYFINVLSFLVFGIGLAFPLLLFSLLSTGKSRQIVDALGKYRRPINITAGLIMLTISLYYLIFVFRIFG